jgi:hypothetical protein
MTSEIIRLECLKLARTRAVDPAAVVAEAKVFEQYVTGEVKAAGDQAHEAPKAGTLHLPKADKAKSPR